MYDLLCHLRNSMFQFIQVINLKDSDLAIVKDILKRNSGLMLLK